MYCKLFASLYQGTLRGRSNEILVFTNLLAHAGRDGTVDKHFRAIAEETGLTMEEVKEAIEVLESPDPESRSPEENGARIVRMDEHRVWGWKIVNYGKYRAIRSEEDRAEQNRLAQQRWRDHNKQSKPASATSKQDKPKEREEGKADGEEDKKRASRSPKLEASGYTVPACFEQIDGFTAALAAWIEARKAKRNPPTGYAIQILINRLTEQPHRALALLKAAAEGGWTTAKWDWLDNYERKNGTHSTAPSGRNVGHNATVSYANRPKPARAENGESAEKGGDVPGL